jgi:hypothetical protein
MAKERNMLNPFVAGEFRINVIKKRKISFAFDQKKLQEEGIVVTTERTKQVTDYEVETAKRATYYLNDWYMVSFMKLNAGSKNLLIWIMYNLKENKDYVELNKEYVCAALADVCGSYSGTTFFNSIGTLRAAGFIAHRSKGTYWINPSFFFRGKRKDFYEEQEKIYGKKIVFNIGDAT